MAFDYRPIVNLTSASCFEKLSPKPIGTSPSAKLGLQFERRILKALAAHVAQDRIKAIDHNPWFKFSDKNGSSICAPDFIVRLTDNRIIVIEVKLTWVSYAQSKLDHFYLPIISLALNRKDLVPLLICHNLVPESPKAYITFTEALASSTKLLHVSNSSKIFW